MQSTFVMHLTRYLQTRIEEDWAVAGSDDPNLLEAPQVVVMNQARLIGFGQEYPRVIGIEVINEKPIPHTSGAAVSDVAYHYDLTAMITYYTNLGESEYDIDTVRLAQVLGGLISSGGYYSILVENVSSGETEPHNWLMKWTVKAKRVE